MRGGLGSPVLIGLLVFGAARIGAAYGSGRCGDMRRSRGMSVAVHAGLLAPSDSDLRHTGAHARFSSSEPAGSARRSPRSPSAARRSSGSCSPTSRSSARARRSRGSAKPDRFAAERVDASEPRRAGGADRAREARRGAQRVRSALQRADLRGRLRGAGDLSRHGDDALAPASRAPYELPGEMLGERQLARHEQWEQAGLLALVGIGVEPGLSDVFAAYAAEELFSSVARSRRARRRRPRRRGL